MKTRFRLSWLLVATCVAVVVLLTNFFSIPLRSSTDHTDYNLPGDGENADSNSKDNAIANEIGSAKVQAKALAKANAKADAKANAKAYAKDNSKALMFARAEGDRVEEKAKHRKKFKTEEEVLRDAFKRCDVDKSGQVSLQEAEDCIAKEARLHLTGALRENFFIFTALDVDPSNGAVSWREHVSHYLRKRGYDSAFIEAHVDTIKGLKREEKEAIMRDKAAWSEAARGDDSSQLSLDEFLAFRHPESSHAAILATVEEILARRDLDGDLKLSLSEYSEPDEVNNNDPSNNDDNNINNDYGAVVGVGSVRAARTDSGEQRRREREFAGMDANKDGKLDRKELVLYTDPRHRHHAVAEAAALFTAADANKDALLSVAEVLQQPLLFSRSKMVDAGKNFHHEF